MQYKHGLLSCPPPLSGWDKVSLDHIKAFGSDFSIGIACSGDGYQITVNVDGNRQKRFNLRRGETIEVRL